MRSIRWEVSHPRQANLEHGACIGAGGSRHGTYATRPSPNGFYAAKHYPGQLRRIRYRDPETGKNLVS